LRDIGFYITDVFMLFKRCVKGACAGWKVRQEDIGTSQHLLLASVCLDLAPLSSHCTSVKCMSSLQFLWFAL